MRNDLDLLVRAAAYLHQQPPGGFGHHDHSFRFVAERGQHLELVVGRRGEHGVQGDDERLRELTDERQHVLAVAAAEDAVLVLEQDDVDVGPAERTGCSDVVAAGALRHGLRDLGPLRARRLVDDDERADVVDAARRRGERPPDVERERTNPACTRWKRRKDRGTHVLCAPFARCPRLASDNAASSIGWLPA